MAVGFRAARQRATRVRGMAVRAHLKAAGRAQKRAMRAKAKVRQHLMKARVAGARFKR